MLGQDRMDRIPGALRHVIVMFFVVLGWIIFKFTDFGMMGIALKGLVGLNHNGFTNMSVGLAFQNNVFFLIFCCVAVTPLGKKLRNILGNLSRRNPVFYWINAAWEVAHPVVLLIISAMALAGNSYNPFLYFRF